MSVVASYNEHYLMGQSYGTPLVFLKSKSVIDMNSGAIIKGKGDKGSYKKLYGNKESS